MTLVPTVPTVKATLCFDVPCKLTYDPDKSRSDDSINITKARIQGNIGRRDSSSRDDGPLFGEVKIIISLVLWRVSEDPRQQAGGIPHPPHPLMHLEVRAQWKYGSWGHAGSSTQDAIRRRRESGPDGW